MDIVIAVLVTLLLISTTIAAVESRKLRDEIASVKASVHGVRGLLESRQSAIQAARTHHRSPGVDARAKTSRPQRSDIPSRGGRVQPKQKRVGGTDGTQANAGS